MTALARMGFADPGRAAEGLASLGTYGCDVTVLTEALGRAPDPDRALQGLLGIVEAMTEDQADALVAALDRDPLLRRRLTSVLGIGTGPTEHLLRHPTHWEDLTEDAARFGHGLADGLLAEVGADIHAPIPIARADAADLLRVAYQRRLVRLAALDLDGVLSLDEVAAELSDLAAAALEASLAIARGVQRQTRPHDEQPALAILGMGKLGGHELNYVSDVDVLFVAGQESDLEAANRLATAVIAICSQPSAEGTLWTVDPALRPEGKLGPLVRTLSSYLSYYDRWGEGWEFQALLKARPVAGDRGLGAQFLAATSPLVWSAADRSGFVDEVRAMRRRVIAHLSTANVDRDLKLGPGGLRDVEFAVQLLQLVHGRYDPSLRSPNTLVALSELIAGGYVGRSDGAGMAESYRFLRTVEHRIQLGRLRRTHLMPTDQQTLRTIGRSIGLRTDPTTELVDATKRHRRDVRRLHEKLFYRPLLAAVARIPGDEIRLGKQAAADRLRALGFAEPEAALRHIEALTSGVSRRAAIQRTLLPAMLEWFADAPDPDAGLLAFRQVSEALGGTPWYLRLLRDEGPTAQRLAWLLGSSRYVVDLIRRAPEAIAILADDAELSVRTRDTLVTEMRSAASRHTEADAAFAAIRSVRRRELFRIAAADLLGLLGPPASGAGAKSGTGGGTGADTGTAVDAVGIALSDLTAAVIEAGTAALSSWQPGPVAVIGMGRLGGGEMGYGSDADVMVVAEHPERALPFLGELRRLLAARSADPPLELDLGLRPEGRTGPLARTLESYAAYYRRWSAPWEAQALLRADPVAGDPDLAADFVDLIAPLRYPPGGIGADDVREIRRIKARVDAERLPRGADPSTHTKLGRGGLADVEWTAQLLQLRHADRLPSLRSTRTVAVLRAAAERGLLARQDADQLIAAWELATRARNATILVTGRPADALPRDPGALSAVARVLGYDPLQTGRFVEDYRRVTRRARRVVERVFA